MRAHIADKCAKAHFPCPLCSHDPLGPQHDYTVAEWLAKEPLGCARNSGCPSLFCIACKYIYQADGSDKREHLDKFCPGRLLPCNTCGDVVRADAYVHHTETACPALEITGLLDLAATVCVRSIP